MMPPTPLPGTLKRARFDNLVIVPASLLPFKAAWQRLADALPAGSALVVTPSSASLQGRTVERIVDSLKSLGWAVTAVPASEVTEGRQLRLLVG